MAKPVGALALFMGGLPANRVRLMKICREASLSRASPLLQLGGFSPHWSDSLPVGACPAGDQPESSTDPHQSHPIAPNRTQSLAGQAPTVSGFYLD